MWSGVAPSPSIGQDTDYEYPVDYSLRGRLPPSIQPSEQPQDYQDDDKRFHWSAPKSLRQVPLASSDRNAEELGVPLVNQSPEVPLQPPPENRTGDEAPAQGSG